jgi:hypothetical protein
MRPEQKATVATQGLAVMVAAAASSASSETSFVKISYRQFNDPNKQFNGVTFLAGLSYR